MQVTINQINASSKEVNITVEPERIQKYYNKYLNKAAKEVAIPGFRKGKAPLSMVERMYADSIADHFQKDVVDDVFDEASKEHDIHYLLYPEVKDIQWEKGTEMVIKIEIEVEPQIEFKELENLKVPANLLSLEDQVNHYLEELRQENSTMVDVEIAAEDDEVECEVTVMNGEEKIVSPIKLFAGANTPLRGVAELIGKKTGDTLEINLAGRLLRFALKDKGAALDMEKDYPVSLIVNNVLHKQIPELDDEFAKDMEFDTLDQMKAKIAEDMKLKNEHQNINIKNNSIISKLFVDNNFELPMKTLEYLAEQQVSQIKDPRYEDYYRYQVRMQIAQEMINVYIMNNLRRSMDIEITDEMVDDYITHQAILEDKPVEAYKEANKKEIEDKDFREVVKNFVILQKIASTAEFYVPEPEETPQAEEAVEAEETVEV